MHKEKKPEISVSQLWTDAFQISFPKNSFKTYWTKLNDIRDMVFDSWTGFSCDEISLYFLVQQNLDQTFGEIKCIDDFYMLI